MEHKLLFLRATILPFIVINVIAMALTANVTEYDMRAFSEPKYTYDVQTLELDRVAVLEKFFEKYKSPLKPHAKTFVAMADKYGLDYRLMPAISCQESTCAKFLIPGSYNPFGWGIYGTNAMGFRSYDEAIETVAKGLSENYLSRGLDTPEKIEPKYTPPSKGRWMRGVRYFYNEMNKLSLATQTI